MRRAAIILAALGATALPAAASAGAHHTERCRPPGGVIYDESITTTGSSWPFADQHVCHVADAVARHGRSGHVRFYGTWSCTIVARLVYFHGQVVGEEYRETCRHSGGVTVRWRYGT